MLKEPRTFTMFSKSFEVLLPVIIPELLIEKSKLYECMDDDSAVLMNETSCSSIKTGCFNAWLFNQQFSQDR